MFVAAAAVVAAAAALVKLKAALWSLPLLWRLL